MNFVQSYFLIISYFLDPKQSNCHTFSKWPWIIEEELLTGPEGSSIFCRDLLLELEEEQRFFNAGEALVYSNG